MASSEKPPADLNALAAEALDLWQEHLAMAASDPAAKAEMMKLLEPSRQVFADWATMMQAGPYANAASAKSATGHAAGKPSAAAQTAHGAEAARPASDDGALRIAQLAHRVAELEKRLAKLEAKPAGKSAKASKHSTKS